MKDKLPSLKNIKDISTGIENEEDVEKLKNLINLFNLNIKKKEILRKNTLSELQDQTINQIQKRIENRPEEFTNKELVDYMKTFSDLLDKNTSLIDDDLNTIQLNNASEVNINIGTEYLSRDSRQRISSVVSDILNTINKQKQNEDIIDVEVKTKEEMEESSDVERPLEEESSGNRARIHRKSLSPKDNTRTNMNRRSKYPKRRIR